MFPSRVTVMPVNGALVSGISTIPVHRLRLSHAPGDSLEFFGALVWLDRHRRSIAAYHDRVCAATIGRFRIVRDFRQQRTRRDASPRSS
jgi:hypothetical protein